MNITVDGDAALKRLEALKEDPIGLACELIQRKNPDLTPIQLLSALVPALKPLGSREEIATNPSPHPAYKAIKKAISAAREKMKKFLTRTSANAVRFSFRNERKLLYDREAGCWYEWTGNVWREDRRGVAAISAAQEICRDVASRSDDGFGAHAVRETEYLARNDSRTSIGPGEWNENLFLLNTPGGVVNLKTGSIYPNRADDLMQKMAGAAPAPNADCPTWRAFLDRAFAGDQELIGFLQRFFGYCLTGDVSHHKFLFLYGRGGAGKSTLVETLRFVLGDYSTTSDRTNFMQHSRTPQTTPGIAKLRGMRFVAIGEVEKGSRWDASLLKNLTGGEQVAARPLYIDGVEFIPQCKLIFSGNNKPGLEVDTALRRRLLLIPFNVAIPEKEQDTNLKEKLRGEWPEILRWLIDGCLEWRRVGLNPPESVRRATEEYFDDEDKVGAWIKERCVEGPGHKASSAEFFESWKSWAGQNNYSVGEWAALRGELKKRGYEYKGLGGTRGRGFVGIGIAK